MYIHVIHTCTCTYETILARKGLAACKDNRMMSFGKEKSRLIILALPKYHPHFMYILLYVHVHTTGISQFYIKLMS